MFIKSLVHTSRGGGTPPQISPVCRRNSREGKGYQYSWNAWRSTFRAASTVLKSQVRTLCAGRPTPRAACLTWCLGHLKNVPMREARSCRGRRSFPTRGACGVAAGGVDSSPLPITRCARQARCGYGRGWAHIPISVLSSRACARGQMLGCLPWAREVAGVPRVSPGDESCVNASCCQLA
jgi:hypothetical protein